MAVFVSPLPSAMHGTWRAPNAHLNGRGRIRFLGDKSVVVYEPIFHVFSALHQNLGSSLLGADFLIRSKITVY